MNLCLIEFSSSLLNNIHSKLMNYFTLFHESSFRWHKSINPVVIGRKETITKRTLYFHLMFDITMFNTVIMHLYNL